MSKKLQNQLNLMEQKLDLLLKVIANSVSNKEELEHELDMLEQQAYEKVMNEEISPS